MKQGTGPCDSLATLPVTTVQSSRPLAGQSVTWVDPVVSKRPGPYKALGSLSLLLQPLQTHRHCWAVLLLLPRDHEAPLSDRDRHTQRDIHTERKKQRQRQTHRETYTERDKQTQRQTDRYTHIHTYTRSCTQELLDMWVYVQTHVKYVLRQDVSIVQSS